MRSDHFRPLVALALLAAAACGGSSSGGPSPTVTSVSPAVGYSGAPVTVEIAGTNFLARSTIPQGGGAPVLVTTHRAWLGSQALSGVAWGGPTRLTATVPKGLSAGTYDLTVENAFGDRGTLKGAFTVLDAPPFSVTLSVDHPTVNVGQPLVFSATVTNSGASPITELQVSAPTQVPTEGGSLGAPSAVTPAPPASLAPGEQLTLSWSYQPTAAGRVEVTAAVTGVDAAGNGVTASTVAPAAVLVQQPAALVAVLEVPGSIALGTDFTVVMRVTNTGGATALGVAANPPPATLAGTNGETATLKSGPLPASADLPGAATESFSWTYTAGSVRGNLTVTGGATGTDANDQRALAATASPAQITLAQAAISLANLTTVPGPHLTEPGAVGHHPRGECGHGSRDGFHALGRTDRAAEHRRPRLPASLAPLPRPTSPGSSRPRLPAGSTSSSPLVERTAATIRPSTRPPRTVTLHVATGPGSPAVGTATAGDASATVTWSAPASDGGSAITGYTVTSIAAADDRHRSADRRDERDRERPHQRAAYTFTVTATQRGRPGSRVGPLECGHARGAGDGTWRADRRRGHRRGRLGDGDLDAPASDGGSAITGYTVTSSPGGLTATTTGATSATVTGLTNGQAYSFTVVARNVVGPGPASTPSNAVTPAAPALAPGAPTGVAATAGDASATVTWTAPANDGGSAITGYTVTSSPGGLTATTTGATSATVSGLTNGTSYSFTVAARNAVGPGPASTPSNAVTPAAPASAPGAPISGAATAGDASATVTWSAPASDGGSPITGYTVTSTPAGGTTGPLGPGARSATVGGLTNGTSYTFTVMAANAVGPGPASTPSNAVTPAAPATAPGAPVIGAATAGDASATATWSAPTSDGGSPITGYTVTSTPAGGTTGPLGPGARSATVGGLTNGTSYTFTVRATNAVGPGPASTPSNAVTPAAPATAPGAPVIGAATAGDASATVTWSAPASDGGSPITGYTVTSSPGAAYRARSAPARERDRDRPHQRDQLLLHGGGHQRSGPRPGVDPLEYGHARGAGRGARRAAQRGRGRRGRVGGGELERAGERRRERHHRLHGHLVARRPHRDHDRRDERDRDRPHQRAALLLHGGGEERGGSWSGVDPLEYGHARRAGHRALRAAQRGRGRRGRVGGGELERAGERRRERHHRLHGHLVARGPHRDHDRRDERDRDRPHQRAALLLHGGGEERGGSWSGVDPLEYGHARRAGHRALRAAERGDHRHRRGGRGAGELERASERRRKRHHRLHRRLRARRHLRHGRSRCHQHHRDRAHERGRVHIHRHRHQRRGPEPGLRAFRHGDAGLNGALSAQSDGKVGALDGGYT